MEQPALPLAVFAAGLIPVLLTPFFAIWYYGVWLVTLWSILAFTFVAAAIWAIGIFLPKAISDRRRFCRWVDLHTHHGRPHHCLACRHLLSDPEAQQCGACGEPTVRLATERNGTPPPDEDRALTSLLVPTNTSPYPAEGKRKRIAEQLNTGLKREHMLDLIGLLLMAADALLVFLLILLACVGFWVWQTLGTGWITTLKVSAVKALYLLIVYMIATHPRRLKRTLLKYGPEGALPWCLSCDADLRGGLRRSKTGIVQKRCGRCGTQVYEYEVL